MVRFEAGFGVRVGMDTRIGVRVRIEVGFHLEIKFVGGGQNLGQPQCLGSGDEDAVFGTSWDGRRVM